MLARCVLEYLLVVHMRRYCYVGGHTSTQLTNSGSLSPVEAVQIDARLSKMATKHNSLTMLQIVVVIFGAWCVDAT